MKPGEGEFEVRWRAARFDWYGPYKRRSMVFETKEAALAAIEIMNRDKERWKKIVG
jgi:hypothetical protein